ncbi:hypothetical protein AJ78_00905 [Emergomyces pasteurianus Ep9510]|uniref:NADP-dependent oxidoreductase domain-containing protein n=1 Tax=Emergomyces pasteurianus Ep9510 TaxID=1447872 RepID=A0A1J9QSE1_9EURO|nr:hypothetical protein AJ78_00905 [Emergomyces pasteurianus Ep9510]
MEYTRLGSSGLKVSKVILGIMGYGTLKWQGWVLNEEESLPLIEHAYKKGIRTWDTADMYSHGKSEEIVGKALKKYNIPRSRVIILTKCFYGVDDQGNFPSSLSSERLNEDDFLNRVGLSHRHILETVDVSVERLGTYIDVLQIHRLDRETAREEIMRTLNEVVESGKARYIGACSMAAWEFQTLQNIAIRNGWHKFISMQNYHNLIAREEEREMIPYCLDSGVSLIPWSPAARGALTRPWASRSTLRENTDVGLSIMVRARESESDKAIIDRVEELAGKKGISMAQDRIDEAVASVQVKLTLKEIQYLEEPYVLKAIYPEKR